MYVGNENQNLVKEERLLRLPEVLKRFPVSRSTWWAGVKSGRFPQSVKIGARTTAWRSADIESLIQRMIQTDS
jgi:predicted DNA-binding transcriptional regulator AlpA